MYIFDGCDYHPLRVFICCHIFHVNDVAIWLEHSWGRKRFMYFVYFMLIAGDSILVRQAGVFVFIEVADLGLVLQWDHGTRVYLRLDPKWKGRVRGLCGNFNDNELDDFQPPTGGLTEISAKVFGDSWRLQTNCPESLDYVVSQRHLLAVTNRFPTDRSSVAGHLHHSSASQSVGSQKLQHSQIGFV